MDRDKVRAFADKVYADTAGAMATGMVYVGTKVGLFRAMAGQGPMRLEEVVDAARLHPRYVEEWLKGMTSAGYLSYQPAAQTFELPEEHAYLLASEGTDHFMGGLALITPLLLGIAPKVAAAFKDGGGVRLSELGADGVEALDWLNCGQYEHRFTSLWINALPDIVERLKTWRPGSRRRLRRRPGQRRHRQSVSKLRGDRPRSRRKFCGAGARGGGGGRCRRQPVICGANHRQSCWQWRLRPDHRL